MLTSSSSMASLVSQAGSLSDRQADISRALGSGTRLTQLANDPLAAAATVRLSSSLAQMSASLSNMQAVQARMQTADSALSAVVTQLTSGVSVAVAAANGTNNASDLATSAEQLSSIRQSVLNLANSSYAGSYLFAGTAAGAPFLQDNTTGEVSYTGDSRTMGFFAGGTEVSTSAAGSSLFGSGNSSVFAVLGSMISTLQGGSTLTTEQVTDLRSALQTVVDGRSGLANSQSMVESASSYLATEQTDLQAEQTSVAASDPVALATQLSASESQRSALLSSLAAIGKGSLFDYISS